MAERGTGLAAAPLQATLDEAAQRGHRQAWLSATKESGRANGFYDKFGFETVGERDFRMGGRVEVDLVRRVQLGSTPLALPVRGWIGRAGGACVGAQAEKVSTTELDGRPMRSCRSVLSE